MPKTIQKVTVYGSGLMGRGIAQVIATSGINVTLFDLNAEMLGNAKSAIQASLSKIAGKKFDKPQEAKDFVEGSMKRISESTKVELSAEASDLHIEAIVENMQLKRDMLGRIIPVLKPNSIVTSNTSSLSIDEIFKDFPAELKSQCAGFHFFNPVPMMRLVEVVRMKDSSEDTIQVLSDFAKSIGKIPVVCKDTPGFIVNRLLVPYLMQAVRMEEEGVASRRDIDTAVKLGLGYPMGPFELLDLVGLDTAKAIIDGWQSQEPGNPLFSVPETLQAMVREGKLGKKTGQGFYPSKV